MKLTTRNILHVLMLLAVIAAATWFRVVGTNWDQGQHLHPDERFLTMVESALQVKVCNVPGVPLESCPEESQRPLNFAEYLDTATSPLNPNNRGYSFYVYGDLPLVLVRYIAEWVGQTGYDQVHLLGRTVMALFDVLVVLLIYLVGRRLYDRRVGLLAAAFSSITVLQIQQAHYFVVDTIAKFFVYPAMLIAVEISLRRQPLIKPMPESAPSGVPDVRPDESSKLSIRRPWYAGLLEPYAWLSIGFGAFVGLATASKINTVALAPVLPIALILHYFLVDRSQEALEPGYRNRLLTRYMTLLVLGGGACVIAFRLAQPYAFLGWGLNPQWLANMKELQGLSNGEADVPYILQWARRSPFFSFNNLTLWGLGLPLGVLVWLGVLVMLWRIIRGELRHLIIWAWTIGYFLWQSLVFTPLMRYQLPIYPLLCLIAAWLVFYLWDSARDIDRGVLSGALHMLALFGSAVVLVLTAVYAYAFTRIYTMPVTRVSAAKWIYQNVPAGIDLHIAADDGSAYQQPVPYQPDQILSAGRPFQVRFRANATGAIKRVSFGHVLTIGATPPKVPFDLSASIATQADADASNYPADGVVTSAFSARADGRGQAASIDLPSPFRVTKGEVYSLRLQTTGGVTLVGDNVINETDWDDGLPLRLGEEGYDGFGGIYPPALNTQVYWDDNADKLQRLEDVLGQGDYLFMSSNRQWGSIPRVPERYPLTTLYYRALLGCPEGKDIVWCYSVAEPGMFKGQLGYELVQVFENYPTVDIPGVLHWHANDQFADESFSVYEHPKVMIFRKSADFSSANVQRILGGVDYSVAVHLTPAQVGKYRSLSLAPAAAAVQQAGGTWSQLFNYEDLQNRYPALGLLLWYLFLFILGLAAYPIIRAAMPGLGDKGYPLARILGLLLLGTASWLLGTFGVPVTRITVAAVFALIIVAGGLLAWRQRKELREEWIRRRRYFLTAEAVFLGFFLFDLLIRIGNPDLWHPSKGGERPMDFSYFNAIIKSTVFPPYDPWYAGGYINYYYFGFVLVGMPVKLLGIVPSIAYNFILPLLFAIVGVGAFSIGWNLSDEPSSPPVIEAGEGEPAPLPGDRRLIAGLLAGVLTVVIGNLGTVRMIYEGLQRLAAPGGNIDAANLGERLSWAAAGLGKLLGGTPLPFGPGDWYWIPSRIIPSSPGNEITEFPFFTFLYSDLHAHMMAMPLAILALGWALSAVKSCRVSILSICVGALAVGALYPTNLSDIYTYLPLGSAALTYGIWRSGGHLRFSGGLGRSGAKLLWTVISLLLFGGLAYLFFQPYHAAYSQGYGSLSSWDDSRTPMSSYLAHWGIFLFILLVWLAHETLDWLATTPVSALEGLRGLASFIFTALGLFALVLIYLGLREVQIGWLAVPMAAWAGVLLLRPRQPDAKRFVLFLVGTALLITVVVEIFAVRGDIGRMNTIFKFYLQAWMLLAIASAAALAWMWPRILSWGSGSRMVVGVITVVLLAGGLMYTITATADKVTDRMTPGVPLTLDSAAYLRYSQYHDFDRTLHLAADYNAIRWMQENIAGSPVIVEANCSEYRWCTRFTIYTGLPGVVGWNWHQRQQRTDAPQLVEQRVAEVGVFYSTPDVGAALQFLKRYGVQYIVVGQLERAEYPPEGIAKFAAQDGKLWLAVYSAADTVIYKVMP